MWYVYAIPTDGSKGKPIGDPYLSFRAAQGKADHLEANSTDGCKYVVRSSNAVAKDVT